VAGIYPAVGYSTYNVLIILRNKYYIRAGKPDINSKVEFDVTLL
jgi:hypothetical protein